MIETKKRKIPASEFKEKVGLAHPITHKSVTCIERNDSGLAWGGGKTMDGSTISTAFSDHIFRVVK